MPELPEVESVRRSLLPSLPNKTIKSIEVRKQKIVRSEHFADYLVGATFKTIERRAKLLIFQFSNREEIMIAHLKMTGQFLFQDKDITIGGGHSPTPGILPELPHKHSHVIWHFADGASLYFNDMRQFGYIELVTQAQLDTIISKYGIEPNTDSFIWEDFEKLFKNRKTNLKAFLLNQSLIAGLGNIYVDEACFHAQVRPDRKVSTITKNEQRKLFEAIKMVIKDAVDAGGTTFQYYTDARGTHGNYRNHLQVFGKTGELCPKTGCVIEKSRVAGRGTHISPEWQK